MNSVLYPPCDNKRNSSSSFDIKRDSSKGISQTVDKALLLQGFAIVGTAFLI